jgi:hypothetical protein
MSQRTKDILTTISTFGAVGSIVIITAAAALKSIPLAITGAVILGIFGIIASVSLECRERS